LTEESKNDYIRLFKTNPNRLQVMYNWVDNNAVETYRESNKCIISAGRFAVEKQFHTLLPKVAKVVQEKHPDWRWNIYGDGELFEEAQNVVDELGVRDFVLFHGKVNDLGKEYGENEIYVMTSAREGMPLVLLEAKANGLPIVAFDVKTGPSEIVREGKDGFLVPYGDVDAMADAICNLIEDDELRREMGRNAKKDVVRFSKDVILNQWIDFIGIF